MKTLAKKLWIFMILVILLVTFGGCVSNYTGRGMISGGETVIFTSTDDLDKTLIEATLPDGERFQGKVVEHMEETTAYSAGVQDIYAKDPKVGSYTTRQHKRTGKSEAVLFGNKGHSMRCNFSGSSFGAISDGTIGRCEISDGRIIDVQFKESVQ